MTFSCILRTFTFLNVTSPYNRYGQRAGAATTKSIEPSVACFLLVWLRGSIQRQTDCALAPIIEIRRNQRPGVRGPSARTYGPRAAFGTFRRVEKYTLHIHIVIMEQGCYLFICGYCFAEISPLRRRVGGYGTHAVGDRPRHPFGAHPFRFWGSVSF